MGTGIFLLPTLFMSVTGYINELCVSYLPVRALLKKSKRTGSPLMEKSYWLLDKQHHPRPDR